MVFIKSIQFDSPSYKTSDEEDDNKLKASGSLEHNPVMGYPDISNDPFLPATSSQSVEGVRLSENDPPPPYQPVSPTTLKKSTISTKPAPPPTASLLELPTCPVCLERMDETSGLLTIQCQHVFHCACLSKWKDGSCPVCRYSSSNFSAIGRSRREAGLYKDDDEDEIDLCNKCGAMSNLWIWFVALIKFMMKLY